MYQSAWVVVCKSSEIDVRNSYTLYVSAEIVSSAFPGSRDLVVISNGETLEMFNAFEVIDVNINQVLAILEINPVQVLYVSDFDPDYPELAPVVFQVTVMNDQQTRSLKTYFYLILEQTGLILTAIKDHGEVEPGSSLVFDNREFDEFEMNDEQSEIMSTILQTGKLPPGTYTYKIEVRQGNNVLTSVEAQNTLLNQDGDLVIISPGAPVDDGPPPSQAASQPLFQWISTANQFDLFIYEVEEGQMNVQEITQQQPVYREMDVVGNSFLYPLAAEELKIGTTYAWQLRAYFNNPKGDAFFDSPLYWFKYDGGMDMDIVIGSIEIIPSYLELYTYANHQFDALIKDFQGNILNVKPTWKVLPDESFGKVDTNGVFTAGPNPRFGAVVATYGGYSMHSVVELKFSGFKFNVLNIMFQNTQRKVHIKE